MNDDDRLFPQVVDTLAEWKEGGPLPHPDTVLDALIQEEVARRRLQERVEAIDEAGDQDTGSFHELDRESLENRLEAAEDRVRTLHRIRGLVSRNQTGRLDDALDALRELRTDVKLHEEDLENLEHAAGPGGENT